MLELDIQTAAWISGTLVPILVALVTKKVADDGVKAIVNTVLSAIAGAFAAVSQNSGQLKWSEFALAMLMTWTVSIATYKGLWKPTGVTEVVHAKSDSVGIG